MLVTRPADRLAEIVAQSVTGGANLVQLRDKTAPADRLREIGTGLRRVTEGQALLVVNGPPERARVVGADGVHLPEAGPSVPEARRVAGEGVLVGRSVHSAEGARRAQEEGADYLLAGTVFASASHPDRAPAGLDWLRAVCATVPLPVIAIGGVTPENAGACVRAGAAGVAVLSPLMGARDPRAVAGSYRAALDAAWAERRTRE